MARRAAIEFVPVRDPIRKAVTKFGGQPVWLTEPQWPISRRTGRPMRFIGQIALQPKVFGKINGRMAYLFMTDSSKDGKCENWDPDKGENAVIIQPGDLLVPVQDLAEGPTVRARSKANKGCEFATRLTLLNDAEEVSDDPLFNSMFLMVGADPSSRNKIGGTPLFLQRDHFPGDDYTTLLLQLDSRTVPFSVDFGDCGSGYAFLSSNGRSGKFLWQCY